MVWEALRKAIQGVESVACKWCGHDPFVVRFVKFLVDHWVVQASVDPIDTEIGEQDEHGKLEKIVEHEWSV